MSGPKKGFQLAPAGMRYAVSVETSNLIKTVMQIQCPWVLAASGMLGDRIISPQSVKVVLGTGGIVFQDTETEC